MIKMASDHNSLESIPSDIYSPLLTIALQNHDAEQVKDWYYSMLKYVRKTAGDNIQAAYGRSIAPVSFSPPVRHERRGSYMTSDERSVGSYTTVGTPHSSSDARSIQTSEQWIPAQDFTATTTTQANDDLLWRVATVTTSPMDTSRSFTTPLASISNTPATKWSEDHTDAWSSPPPHHMSSNYPSRHASRDFTTDYAHLPVYSREQSLSMYGMTESMTTMPVLDSVEPDFHTPLRRESSSNGLGLNMGYPITCGGLYSSPIQATMPEPPRKKRRHERNTN